MNLNTVQEIESAIAALTPELREELYVWLDEHYSQAVDRGLRPRSKRAGSMTASAARLPIISPEEPNPFNANPHDAPYDCGFLERLSGFARQHTGASR